MEAVFHLAASLRDVPAALSGQLAQWGLHAVPLDPSAQDGPLSGWHRIESTDLSRLEAAVQVLQSSRAVDAAYIKPEEGPPA